MGIKPSMELDYFREIPREDATPAEAAYLYYFKNGGMKYKMPNILSSTMLNLALKKYIEFEVNEKNLGKDEITVKLLGGDLIIKWDNCVYMKGPASIVFEGSYYD